MSSWHHYQVKNVTEKIIYTESKGMKYNKFKGKLDCSIFEMFWIHKKKLSLNTQSDSIHSKLFV